MEIQIKIDKKDINIGESTKVKKEKSKELFDFDKLFEQMFQALEQSREISKKEIPNTKNIDDVSFEKTMKKPLDTINLMKEEKELKQLKEITNLLSQVKKDSEHELKTIEFLKKTVDELKKVPKEDLWISNEELNKKIKIQDAKIEKKTEQIDEKTVKEKKETEITEGKEIRESRKIEIKEIREIKLSNVTIEQTLQNENVKTMNSEVKTLDIKDLKDFIQEEVKTSFKFQVNNSKSISIQLNPEHLGIIDIRIEKTDDGLSIDLKFQNLESKEKIEELLGEIQDELEKEDIDLTLNLEWEDEREREKEKEQEPLMKNNTEEDDEENGSFNEKYEQELKG